MSQQLTLKIQTVTWMQPVNIVNSELIHLVYAQVMDYPNLLIVIEERTGSSRYYCKDHEMIFWPFKMGCPGCRNNVEREAPKQASVTECDTPKIQSNSQS